MGTQPGTAAGLAIDTQLRTATIIHWAIMASGVLFIVLGELMSPRVGMEPPAQVLVLVFGLVAATDAAVAFFVHNRWVTGSEEALRNNPADRFAIRRWMQGSIVSVAMCESIILFGMVMRMVGASSAVVWPFYAAGVLLMLLFVPRKP